MTGLRIVGLCACLTDERGVVVVPCTAHSVPQTWVRPAGSNEPCPECGSRTCPGFYKPDGNHLLAF